MANNDKNKESKCMACNSHCNCYFYSTQPFKEYISSPVSKSGTKGFVDVEVKNRTKLTVFVVRDDAKEKYLKQFHHK